MARGLALRQPQGLLVLQGRVEHPQDRRLEPVLLALQRLAHPRVRHPGQLVLEEQLDLVQAAGYLLDLAG